MQDGHFFIKGQDMPRFFLICCVMLMPLALLAQAGNPGKPLPEVSEKAATNTAAPTNSQPNIFLDRLTLDGSLKKDNSGLYYSMNLGLSWRVHEDNLFTRLRIDNVEVFDAFSLLGKYSFVSFSGPLIHPYVILINEIYNKYPDGEGHTAARIQWGGGFNFNPVETERFLLRIESGIDVTHEISTGLPDLVFWWRSRIKGEMEIIKNIRLGGTFILSEPFRNRLEHWYDYEFRLAYRLTKTLSVVGSVRFYDHRVTESKSDRFIHQISLMYSL